MRVATVCLISVLVLAAGCSKKPEPTRASSAAPVLAHPDAAGGGGGSLMPHRKSGLWEMAIDSNGGPGVRMTAQVCVDAATDKDFSWRGPHAGSKNCQKTEIHPGLGGVTIDSVCRIGARTAITHGVVTGDFNSAYAMDMTTRFDPAIKGMPAEMKTAMKARWLGPCPAGVKPGHMTMGGMHVGR